MVFKGLKLTADEDNSSVGYEIFGLSNKDIYISKTENGEENSFESWDGTAITLNKGEHIFVWNKLDTLSINSYNYFRFVMTGKIKASGNVDSMINFSDIKEHCYDGMFFDCSSLTQAPELPATNLTDYCYESMFSFCSSLTKSPELPAMNLVEGCYRNMFSNCSSLTEAPELPAINLAERCYQNMFFNCSSLTKAPELPAMNLAKSCYEYMFDNCESLTQAPELPAMNLAERCYNGMFHGCLSLTKAPDLPATKLEKDCYDEMFTYCDLLTQTSSLKQSSENSNMKNEILEKAKNIINGERAQQYGDAEDNFSKIAKFWSDYKGIDFSPIDVANMMILLKIARTFTGSLNKIDNYIDICGYAALGGDINYNSIKKGEKNEYF